MTRRLMTVQECAEYLGRTERAVRALIEKRQLPGVVRSDRTVRIDVYKIDAWIKEHTEADP